MENTTSQWAALIMRLSLGAMFLAHGLLKVFVFTLPGTAAFFESISFPGWAAYIVGPAEVLAGIALIVGFKTRLVSIATLPILVGAVVPHWANGWLFSAPNGGWEYPAFLIAATISLALLGSGKFAIDNKNT